MLDLRRAGPQSRNATPARTANFFYGVRTTGVYCRPGCASRRPLRANTVFFETTAAARGRRVPIVQALPSHGRMVGLTARRGDREGLRLLRTTETMPSLAELAEAAAISRFHFHRVFKQITGVTPRDYARSHRLGRLGEKLDSGQPITASIYASGFGSSSRAYEAAPAGLGMTPGARRRGGGGETIRFVTVATPLGWALVAATERGVCMTALGDDRDASGGIAAALPGCGGDRRGCRTQGVGRSDRALHHCTRAKPRPAARYPRHRVPGAGVARPAEDPAWARPRAIPRSPPRSASPRRCAPSPKHVRRTSSH